MERKLLNSEGLMGNFDEDSELLKGLFLAIPQINLINHFIYQLHYNSNFDCLQSVLQNDNEFKYRDKPQFIDFSFSKESLLKPKIENGDIILNQNETSFLNNLYFEKTAKKRFLTFRNSLNNFLFNHRSQHRYKIITLLKFLRSIPFNKATDSTKIVGTNLDYPKFKDIITHQLELTNNIINETILNLENQDTEQLSLEDRLLLKAIKSENQELIFFVQELNSKSLELFTLKWENNAFKALETIYVNSSKTLSHNFRLIFFLIEPKSMSSYKDILDALPHEYDLSNAQRYFNELKTDSKHDILTATDTCNKIKKIIAENLN